MLKNHDFITVHFINHWMHRVPTEEKTGYSGIVFEVKTENGKPGFDGNITRSAYRCNGELFTPFSSYAWTVIFRNEKTGKLYRYSNILNALEDVTGVNDGYIEKIIWLNSPTKESYK